MSEVKMLNELAKVVNEPQDYGQGYYECRFGFCIGDRIFMVGIEGYAHNQETADAGRALCNAIVDRWNTALHPERHDEEGKP